MVDPSGSYLHGSRLRDILALIQILGFGDQSDLTPREICVLLQEVGEEQRPLDERLWHWERVAREHPEFFRVSGKSVSISLISRFVVGTERPALKSDVVQRLMQTAVDIHDRESRRSERWTLYVPMLIAIIGAVGSVVAALVGILAARH